MNYWMLARVGKMAVALWCRHYYNMTHDQAVDYTKKLWNDLVV